MSLTQTLGQIIILNQQKYHQSMDIIVLSLKMKWLSLEDSLVERLVNIVIKFLSSIYQLKNGLSYLITIKNLQVHILLQEHLQVQLFYMQISTYLEEQMAIQNLMIYGYLWLLQGSGPNLHKILKISQITDMELLWAVWDIIYSYLEESMILQRKRMIFLFLA